MVGESIGERRAIVKHVFGVNRALLDGGLEGVIGRPIFENSPLDSRQICFPDVWIGSVGGVTHGATGYRRAAVDLPL